MSDSPRRPRIIPIRKRSVPSVQNKGVYVEAWWKNLGIVGRRTGVDVKSGKVIRRLSSGAENFNDYWTESEGDDDYDSNDDGDEEEVTKTENRGESRNQDFVSSTPKSPVRPPRNSPRSPKSILKSPARHSTPRSSFIGRDVIVDTARESNKSPALPLSPTSRKQVSFRESFNHNSVRVISPVPVPGPSGMSQKSPLQLISKKLFDGSESDSDSSLQKSIETSLRNLSTPRHANQKIQDDEIENSLIESISKSPPTSNLSRNGEQQKRRPFRIVLTSDEESDASLERTLIKSSRKDASSLEHDDPMPDGTPKRNKTLRRRSLHASLDAEGEGAGDALPELHVESACPGPSEKRKHDSQDDGLKRHGDDVMVEEPFSQENEAGEVRRRRQPARNTRRRPQKRKKVQSRDDGQADSVAPSTRRRASNAPEAKGLRRSKRNRVQTLQRWRNEHICYKWTEEGYVVDHIDPGFKDSPVIRKRQRNKKKDTKKVSARGKKMHNLTIHNKQAVTSNYSEELPEEAAVYDHATGQEVEKEVVRSSKSLLWYNPDGEKLKPSDQLAVCRIFTESGWAMGRLELQPLAEKPRQILENETLVFFVIYGKVKVKIYETCFILETDDSFQVPRGNFYSITNLRKDKAELLYFIQNSS